MLVDASFNDLTHQILASAIEVHRVTGPGLLESLYLPCLERELSDRQLRFESQRQVPLVYKGVRLGVAYRVDLVVEDLVVVELKAAAALIDVHKAQLLTYMRLLDCPVGLLINFNVPRLMDGVKRLIHPGWSRRERATRQ